MFKKLNSWFRSSKENTADFEQKRVLIFGLGRSGSTLLEDLLESTGYFKAHGELFNPKEPIQKEPLQYFIDLANECRDKHFISHVKTYEMESVDQSDMSKSEFLEGLIEHGWEIIYLTRTNKLRHNLSSYRAQESSIFHTDKILTIHATPVDCFVFKHGIKRLLSWEEEEKELIVDLPYLEIEYEVHLENGLSHQGTVRKILNYLNLPYRSAETKHKKILQGSLKSLIENYDEFEGVMIESGFIHYLD